MNDREIFRAKAFRKRNLLRMRKTGALLVRIALILGATILVMFLRSRH